MKINYNYNYNYGINHSGSVKQVATNLPRDWPQVISFKERFSYTNVELEDYRREIADDETALLASIFAGLVCRVMKLGLDIRHGKKKKQGDYTIEAYFVPRNKYTKTEAYIMLPLAIEFDLIAKKVNHAGTSLENLIAGYTARVVAQTSNRSLIRLLVVMAHEFGHFLSYCHGNHDQDLAKGILFMQRNQVVGRDSHTSLVFIEESIAWDYGMKALTVLGFAWWKVFEKIKLDSLQAYFLRLELAKATFPVYCRLARLDDFRKSIVSNYFNS